MKQLFIRLNNKYLLAFLVFLAWMFFFDKNDMISQYTYRSKVTKLKEERDFYQKEIASVKKDLSELDSDMTTVEKFAREKYYMKKDNEDVYVIVNSGENQSKTD